MKKHLLFILLAAAVLPLQAQIAVGLALNRSVYMQYEDVFACVTLRNDTGRVMIFGKDPRLQGFLLFEVLDSRGRRVAKIPEKELSVTGLVLNPGEIKNLVIPVSRYYDVERPDYYRINCFVSHNLLNHEFRSRDVTFSVDTGVPIWKRTVGVPEIDTEGQPHTEGPAVSRDYIIRTMRENEYRYYYLVIEDNKQVFGVTRLGPVFGQEKYQVEVDMFNRFHVLVPISPRITHYLSFNVNGMLCDNSYWKTTGTIPMLYRDPATGKVTRIGGEEAKPGIDFKDPNAGLKTASQLMAEKGSSGGRSPKAHKNSGLLDLGKGMSGDLK